MWRLLVGLGNPGSRYERTRHNVGFMALDRLAERHDLSPRQEKFQSLIALGRIGGVAVLLAKPQTYMNLSGQAVGRIVEYFRVPPAQILVLHDDMDLAVGRLKVSASGGAAGHKGVASIIACLGTDAFIRVRLGVGRPSDRIPAEHYVLSPFAPEEAELIGHVLILAAEAAELFISQGVAAAQQRYNDRTTTAWPADRGGRTAD
ncbi:MAG: aminoacyl-tRNA hydrolase [Pseudomonadota bacterium]